MIYRRAKRYREDKRLSTSRAAKVLELQDEIKLLCKRSGENFLTEKQAEKKCIDKSFVTSLPEQTMIKLQNELVENLDCLFVFVSLYFRNGAEVEPTNNQSERALRGESQVRKMGNTSKSEKGARRRSTIISVLGTLSRRVSEFTLSKLLEVVLDAKSMGVSLFQIAKPPNCTMGK
jgi:hypothetical protein